MTKDKDFKRLVRARMEKTGQSYAAAKASLLVQRARIRERAAALLPVSDPRRQAEMQLARMREHLHDAVDSALAAGLGWREIGGTLGLDPELARMWIQQE